MHFQDVVRFLAFRKIKGKYRGHPDGVLTTIRDTANPEEWSMDKSQRSTTDAGAIAISGPDPAASVAETANSGQPPLVEDLEKKRTAQQTAFLLGQLLEATPHHRLKRGDANRKIRALVRRQI